MLDGESFSEGLKAVFHDLAEDIFRTVVTSGLRQTILGLIPDADGTGETGGILESVGGFVSNGFGGEEEGEGSGFAANAANAVGGFASSLLGGGEEGESGADLLVEGAEALAGASGTLKEGAASTVIGAVKQALGFTAQTTAATTLASSALALTTAATALNGAAVAITAASTADSTSSILGAKTGGFFSAGGITRYMAGGMIRGPGSSTSDSIAGIHLNGKGGGSPIAVSNGEAILNGGAVNFLGEDFVHMVNKAGVRGYASGGLLKSASASVSSVKSAAPPTESASAGGGEGPVEVYNFFDEESLTEKMLSTPAGTRGVLNIIGDNPNKISGLR